ncbi:MAG: hypothetical protein ACRDVE_10655 [Actinocrinis sp.]
MPMRRRSALSAGLTAGAALLALSVAGCGASAAQPPAALGTGAGVLQPSNAATPLATLPADAPKFAVPADFHLVIDADRSGNATADKVLLDAQYQFYGFVEALSTGNVDDKIFKAWTIEDAYAGLSRSISTWKSRGERLTGTDHLYNRKVTVSGGGTKAVYTACEDSSQAYPLHIPSGKKDTNTAGTGNYTLWQGTFVKQTSGDWALNLIFTKPGASQCVVG